MIVSSPRDGGAICPKCPMQYPPLYVAAICVILNPIGKLTVQVGSCWKLVAAAATAAAVAAAAVAAAAAAENY